MSRQVSPPTYRNHVCEVPRLSLIAVGEQVCRSSGSASPRRRSWPSLGHWSWRNPWRQHDDINARVAGFETLSLYLHDYMTEPVRRDWSKLPRSMCARKTKKQAHNRLGGRRATTRGLTDRLGTQCACLGSCYLCGPPTGPPSLPPPYERDGLPLVILPVGLATPYRDALAQRHPCHQTRPTDAD